uniref:SUMO-activating enzyme subunit 1 n=1 Tax=Doryrhamphus excisus TaxID=161450 RepID=UPI0025ADB752|nr:SUMO-activating enzyme subunit 1 [Doryrhamphus excisus]XP_057937026.1 SUMO-activating enzyme subunit 1 [Doryrhamphus excisus]XP_057937027.1 SUMO-activating enzyme subunit 1 [Doryrhamphus excisus]
MIDMIEKEDPVITEEEAAQYDRQIRLWGLDAQKRLRGSRVLLAGLGGLGAEVAKNLILAGVKGLTLLDHEKATEELCRAQFLVPVSMYGQSRAKASLERAQNLNPMVEVLADTGRIEEKPDSFFLQFSAVCLTGCSRDVMVRVDHLCSQHNIMVFCGDVHGYYGYMFCNLGPEHSYVEEKPKVVKPSADSNDGPEAKKAKVDPNETTMVKKTARFCRLKEALQVDWTTEKAKACLKKTPVDYFLLHVLLKFRTDKGRDPEPQSFAEDSQLLRQIRDDVLEALGVSADILSDDFISYCFSVMSPVCAVVGGVLGQEIVKALSQRDAPHRNFFFFDGRKGNGMVDYFGPN